MYNLPHCLLEQFHSLVVKNPNTLFTTFTCLFLGQSESSFAFGLRSPKPIHVSYFTCRKGHILLPFYHKKAILIYVSLPSLIDFPKLSGGSGGIMNSF